MKTMKARREEAIQRAKRLASPPKENKVANNKQRKNDINNMGFTKQTSARSPP
jgi:hypothetical protein